MLLDLHRPASYLITSGATTRETTSDGEDFARLIELVRAAVAIRISLIQLREKMLRSRVLYELARRSAQITRGSATRLLVNDRADIARAAGADGVHLTARSLEACVVRRVFGESFLIGVSTHSLHEARAARDGGADFAVFGPIYETPSKREFGAPIGLSVLSEAARELSPFPLFAIGGISRENVRDVLAAGARGVAAIRLFEDASNLSETVREIESAVSGSAQSN